jgi:DNA polymerase
MKTLSIDIETYSSIDLTRSGVYKYTESPDFRILLFGYAIDEGSVQVVDIASGEEIPEGVLSALTDPLVTKWAYNANFERICLSRYLREHYPEYFSSYGHDEAVSRYLDPLGWKCSMVLSASLGLPLSLKAVGEALHLEEQKMAEGTRLIRKFSVPGVNGRVLPKDSPGDWALFKEYNKRDVEVEMEIRKALEPFPVSPDLWDEYHRDQAINDRGILVDRNFVESAMVMGKRAQEEITRRLQQLTGLSNPRSPVQMKKWLFSKDHITHTLCKKERAHFIAHTSGDIHEALVLYSRAQKSSLAKYTAMADSTCSDGRARGMFQFYGAARSGRWAGRRIQLQNLPRNSMEDLDLARKMVKDGDYEKLSFFYDEVTDVLSQLIRTAFIPRKGYKFIVSDFSAIEARVLSYMAGERWRMEVFAKDGDIYAASASAMFHVPVVKHGIHGDLRQKGKIAELALGYGGGEGALKAMGALDMGLTEEELKPLVTSWRTTNPHIVDYWWKVDRAVKEAIENHRIMRVGALTIFMQKGILFIELPSGRRLAYVGAAMKMGEKGYKVITYMGVGATKKWERIESYGPKFVENIIQAVSRDILCHAMKNLRGRYIGGHVHDELIIECPEDTRVCEITETMAEMPDWMPELVMRADGYETYYYRKE